MGHWNHELSYQFVLRLSLGWALMSIHDYKTRLNRFGDLQKGHGMSMNKIVNICDGNGMSLNLKTQATGT